MKKRTLLCLLVLLLAVSVLFGCQNGEGETATGDDTTVSSPEALPIVSDGKAVSVIYAFDDLDGQKQAKKIAQMIENLTGVKAECRDDLLPGGQKVRDAAVCEILVGDVSNCAEVEAARDTLGYGECGIITVGKKVCLLTRTADGIERAVNVFVHVLDDSCDADAKTIMLAPDLRETRTTKEQLNKIPIFVGKQPHALGMSSEDCYEARFTGVTEEELDSYLETVAKSDYTLYAENSDTGTGSSMKNRFLTYQSESDLLTLLYTPHNKTLRVLSESLVDTALAGREAENDYIPISNCSTMLTQIGLNYKKGVFNGMSYVMRLADGSFLVVDGGHNDAAHAERLYNILKKQAPNPDKIVIAAWFITHAHSDHAMTFTRFAQAYSKKVTVEKFVFSFPSESQYKNDTYLEGKELETHTAIGTYYPTAQVQNAHTGQRLYLRNAKVEILYTAEMMTGSLIDYYNSASMVFSIEVEGVKTLITGDIGVQVASVMNSMYSDATFACDILQLPHHGISSSPQILYPKMDPAYVLCPLGTGELSVTDEYGDAASFLEKDYNKFFYTSENVKKIWVANDDVVVLTLRSGNVSYVEYDNATAYLTK